MKVVLFGASGMVGQGALRECLLAPDVESVLVIGRSPTGQTHAKLRELVHADFSDFSAIEGDLAGYDACFFCLGTSAAGMSEAAYTRVTLAGMSTVRPAPSVMVAACVIAAASFLSLLVFGIQSIRTFASFSALGILSALAIELTFIPAVRAITAFRRGP